jgi:hypothetical protein
MPSKQPNGLRVRETHSKLSLAQSMAFVPDEGRQQSQRSKPVRVWPGVRRAGLPKTEHGVVPAGAARAALIR